MIAYKLLRVRSDGTLGSLYIDKRKKLKIGIWLQAESHPTKGYAVRPGWHTLEKPEAPHIKMTRFRKWYRVKISDYVEFERPKAQGGMWLIAQKIKILNPVYTETQADEIKYERFITG